MTHATETGAINQLHFSGADFWYVCHANLGLDSSGIPAPIRTLFYSKPESGVHVIEMMTCDCSMIIVAVLRHRVVVLCSAIICLFI